MENLKKIKLGTSLIKTIESRKAHIQEGILTWGKQNYRKFAWRENRTPYSVLVSEILLKRTTASAVQRIYKKFMLRYPNIGVLAKANREKLEELLLRIGYHKRRTGILIDIGKYILNECNGQIPKSRKELLEIPFIGQYTAGAILSFGYSIPSAMVDSNIERIITRLFSKDFSDKSTARIVREIADMIAPDKENQAYNYGLLDLGAVICRYGIPKCNTCPINMFCDYCLSEQPCKT